MSDKPHLGGAYEVGDGNTFMPDVFGYLLVKYEVKSVIDIGAAYGHNLKWFAEWGLCNVVGVEGMQEYVDKPLVPGIICHDYTLGKSPVTQQFDLAWSSEFVEHVEERFMENYMKDFQLARHVVITHAEPGQPGYHHVNCKSDGYWAGMFLHYGMKWDQSETEILRRTDRWKSGWGRRSLMVFHRL